MDWHAGQDGLEEPIDEECEEASRGDSCICGEVVGKTGEAWPDCCDTVAQKVACLNTEDGSPHCSNESAETDGRVAAVHAKDGSNNDGVRHCICSAHFTSQCDDHGANGKSEENNGDGLAGSKTE